MLSTAANPAAPGEGESFLNGIVARGKPARGHPRNPSLAA